MRGELTDDDLKDGRLREGQYPANRLEHDRGDGIPPSLRKRPDGNRWIMIDIDKVRLPKGHDGLDRPDQAIDWYISNYLPHQFRGAGYHWQLSSSAGVPVDGQEPDRGVLNAHVWFVTDAPIHDRALAIWLTEQSFKLDVPMSEIDPSVAKAVQPHYTAAPILEDVEVEIDTRSDVVEGGGVHVPSRHWERVEREVLAARQQANAYNAWVRDGCPLTTDEQDAVRQQRARERRERGLPDATGKWEDRLAAIGDGGGLEGFNAPIVAASASFVGQLGEAFDWEAHAETFKQSVREHIQAAPKSAGRPSGDVARYESDMYLDECLTTAARKFAKERPERSVSFADPDNAMIEHPGLSASEDSARSKWRALAEKKAEKAQGWKPEFLDFAISQDVMRDHSFEAAVAALKAESDAARRVRDLDAYARRTVANAALDARNAPDADAVAAEQQAAFSAAAEDKDHDFGSGIRSVPEDRFDALALSLEDAPADDLPDRLVGKVHNLPDGEEAFAFRTVPDKHHPRGIGAVEVEGRVLSPQGLGKVGSEQGGAISAPGGDSRVSHGIWASRAFEDDRGILVFSTASEAVQWTRQNPDAPYTVLATGGPSTPVIAQNVGSWCAHFAQNRAQKGKPVEPVRYAGRAKEDKPLRAAVKEQVAPVMPRSKPRPRQPKREAGGGSVNASSEKSAKSKGRSHGMAISR
ncbi:hypothetical protein [Rhodovibrio sodomensis]|uniref:hypothetical protein n=1 Tax=Rhodovibrio sodomensis TaxID=1088 RepID=UPI001908B9F6|nr:hypothetical protein [Rhodovibrio sodomensis]